MPHFFHTYQPETVVVRLVKRSHLAELDFRAIPGDSRYDRKSHGVLPNIAHNHWFVRPGFSAFRPFHFSQPKKE